MVTIIDNNSRYCMAVPIKDKTARTVLGALKKCIQDLEAKPKRIYTDWGSEFKGEFEAYCTENGIKMEKSCPYTAWQNGLVERCNRSLVNIAKTLMIQSKLPVEFWAHAVCTAAYTLNRLSHVRLPNGITPYEAMHDARPNIENMRVFGCHAEVLIEKRYRVKDMTDVNSESAIFIGYCRQSSGYIFYIPDKHLVVSRRDARFNQAFFPARVGETMLVDKNVIKTDYYILPDRAVNTALPDGPSIKTASPEKPPALPETKPKQPCLGAKNPHDTSPDVENNLKLIPEPGSIIRASTKIEQCGSAHIYGRVNKADGISIPDALKISYKHPKHPDEVLMYKIKDIKYDIQKGWIYLVSPRAEASGGIQLSFGDSEIRDDGNSPAPSEPHTPLSAAPTPFRATPSTSNSGNRPARSAANAATSRIRSSFSSTGRPVMPACLNDNDSISAMLERGTLERDFALSMQALGFGDEPVSYKERL